MVERLLFSHNIEKMCEGCLIFSSSLVICSFENQSLSFTQQIFRELLLQPRIMLDNLNYKIDGAYAGSGSYQLTSSVSMILTHRCLKSICGETNGMDKIRVRGQGSI